MFLQADSCREVEDPGKNGKCSGYIPKYSMELVYVPKLGSLGFKCKYAVLEVNHCPMVN